MTEQNETAQANGTDDTVRVPTLQAAPDNLTATEVLERDMSESVAPLVPMSEADFAALQAGGIALDSPPPVRPPPSDQVLVERVDYTLNSADAAAINVHLEGDYVKEGMPVTASRNAEGGLFVAVHEAVIPLGVG